MTDHEASGEGSPKYFDGFREMAALPSAGAQQSRPLDTGGDALPFGHLEDRRFEILAYCLKQVEFDGSGHRVTLMQGVGERGRDVVVHDSAGRVVQIIQCKHYQARLSAPDLRKELLKLALHHHLDASILDTAGVSYELWCSGGFSEPAATLLGGWPSGWSTPELAADADEVIKTYEAFKGLKWGDIGADVVESFRQIVTPISVTAIDITRRVRHCLPVYEVFFVGKVVMDRADVMDAVKAGMKDVLRSTGSGQPLQAPPSPGAAQSAQEQADEVASLTLDEVKGLLSAGKLDVAVYQLDKLRNRSWETLGSRAKFRWLTLRADAQLKCGNNAEAATLLLEAKNVLPEEETALSNEVLAFELLGDRDRAHSVALVAKNLKPFSAEIHACAIRTAGDDETAQKVFDERPATLKDSPAVWLAMATRSAGLPDGERTARRATELAPNDPRAWDALGAVLLRRELEKVDPDSPAQQGVLETRRLEEAEECFTRVIELSAADPPTGRAFAMVRRATVKSLLQRAEEAQEDFLRAQKEAPDDPEILLAVARMEAERGRHDEAIRVLRQLVMRKEDEEANFFLALALWDRDSTGDRVEATGIFGAVGKQSRHYNEPANVLAVEGLIGQQRFDEALNHLTEVESRVDRSLVASLRARVAFLRDDVEEASRLATLAIATIAPTTSKAALHKLAKLLGALKRLSDALNVWERLYSPGVADDAALQLVECAGRLGRHERVLQICSDVRANGVMDEFLIHWEVSLLDRYNPGLAVEVLESFLRAHPQHNRARLHLVHLAFRLGMNVLAASQVPYLPAVTEAFAEEGAVVVKVLTELGRHEEALEYSYNLLRRHFAEPTAHRAFRDAVLEREISEPFEPPAEVLPGVAVLLEEHGHSEWYVVEDSTVPAHGVENELPAGAALRTKLLGKHVGDEVVLSDSPGMRRSARVVELLPKRVFRIRDVWQKWQYRFPNHQEMWMMRVGKDDSGDQCDFTSLLEMLQATRKGIESAESYYLSHPIPLAAFAGMLGHSVLLAQGHVARSSHLPLRCCVGSAAEYSAAAAVLSSAVEVVVDITALATLLMLERVDVLKLLGKRVLITPSTASALRAYVALSRPSSRESMSLHATECGPVINKQSADEQEHIAASAEAFLVAVLESATVVGCEELAVVEPEKRKLYEDVVGASALETAVVAAQPFRIMWTDDGVAASLFSRESFAGVHVWTQAILRWLNDEGVLDADAYTQASARLVGWRYEFTSVNPKILQACGNLAEWNVRRWPLQQAVQYLALGTVNRSDAAFLGAKLLADGYLDTVLSETRTQLVASVAEAIARRDDHEEALRRFAGALRRTFGLNAVGLDDCLRTISAWQREYARRPR